MEYVNNITGVASKKQMEPKESDVSFTVKWNEPIVIAGFLLVVSRATSRIGLLTDYPVRSRAPCAFGVAETRS